MIQAGNYVGVAAGSMTILLISSFGWKKAYGIMAVVGSLFGLGLLALVKEPMRGRYLSKAEKKKEKQQKKEEALLEASKPKMNPIASFLDSMKVVLSLPCAKNVLIASSLRNVGGMVIAAFLPVFFGKNFPSFKAEYALLNAAALSICGLIASLSGGILADKFEKKSYWTKSFIAGLGCALSVPLIAIGTL